MKFSEPEGAGVAPEPVRPPWTMEVHVLYTGVASTLAALRTAAQFAQGLGARIRLLVLETVPYPLPVDRPEHDLAFLRRRFRALVETSALDSAGTPVEATAEIVLCRGTWEGLEKRLARRSVIVIGRRNNNWRTRALWRWTAEDRLARRLRSAGHHVVRTSCGVPEHGARSFQ
ncbi:MAG: hypothetical protein HY821_23400 [Acidobacteria bacterium]|nr:hypothetical protein [Acidobacteriota bacterium]